MAVLSISASPLSSTSVGTRRSGLYGAIFSPSPKVDHGRCSKPMPYSRSAIATRRTKEESYWPISIMGSAYSQELRASYRIGRRLGWCRLGDKLCDYFHLPWRLEKKRALPR